MARPAGSQNKDKPFRDALRMQIVAAGDDMARLRRIADALLTKAEEGDVSAIREVGDRLDGKPAQAIIGGDEDDPAVRLAVEKIERVIIDPKSEGRDGEGIPPTPGASAV